MNPYLTTRRLLDIDHYTTGSEDSWLLALLQVGEKLADEVELTTNGNPAKAVIDHLESIDVAPFVVARMKQRLHTLSDRFDRGRV